MGAKFGLSYSGENTEGVKNGMLRKIFGPESE